MGGQPGRNSPSWPWGLPQRPRLAQAGFRSPAPHHEGLPRLACGPCLGLSRSSRPRSLSVGTGVRSRGLAGLPTLRCNHPTETAHNELGVKEATGKMTECLDPTLPPSRFHPVRRKQLPVLMGKLEAQEMGRHSADTFQPPRPSTLEPIHSPPPAPPSPASTALAPST